MPIAVVAAPISFDGYAHTIATKRTMTTLTAEPITSPHFLAYGQAITPVADRSPYGEDDAQLHFDQGPIRFYIEMMEHPGELLKVMARHTHCSQCLASADAEPWWIAVAAPHLDSDQIDLSTIRLFRVEPRQAVKLSPGTWHAGPYFNSSTAMFYNLELSNTNEADHTTRRLEQTIHLQLS